MEKPSLPKGTRDFGPLQMGKRQFIFDSIRTVFKKYGFQPLETPAMENLSTLTGKYGEEGDQLLFKVLNSGDFLKDVPATLLDARNSRQLTTEIAEKGLRYDLTVPFARYVVMNRHELTFPFRRYQIQPVWRADRPQKGRYREFCQCDADVVGTRSLVCEAEIILMIREIFGSLGIQDYTIKINHRAVLSALAKLAGSGAPEMALFVAIDKLDKIGIEKVREELKEKGFGHEGLDLLFRVLSFTGDTTAKIGFLQKTFAAIEGGINGTDDITEILQLLKQYGSDDQHVELDIALARGLSYYTGCIFEIKINSVAIGSVSGGGRYDNLTGVFGMPDVSGVGISFGVDRLYDAMEELNLFPSETNLSSAVLIAHADQPGLAYGMGIVHKLRVAGIASEIYPESSRLKKQFDYANKRSIPFVIVIGSEEMSSGLLTVKDMRTGNQQGHSISAIIDLIRTQLHIQS